MGLGFPLTHVSLDAASTLNEVGKNFPLGECERASFQTSGIVTGDEVQLQFSDDGSTWADEGSAITTNTVTQITTFAKYARTKLTAIAGGGDVTTTFNGYSAG